LKQVLPCEISSTSLTYSYDKIPDIKLDLTLFCTPYSMHEVSSITFVIFKCRPIS